MILILLGAAGSTLIALRSGDRPVLRRGGANAGPGQQITEDDLASGDLAGATGALLLWSERDKIKDQYTTGWIYPGQFVSKKNFIPDPVPAGGALIGISVESGRAPAEVGRGRRHRPPGPGPGRQPGNRRRASVLVEAAEVTATNGSLTDGKTGANTTVNVTVLIRDRAVTTVAAAAAAKTLVLVKLADSVKPEISNDPGAR